MYFNVNLIGTNLIVICWLLPLIVLSSSQSTTKKPLPDDSDKSRVTNSKDVKDKKYPYLVSIQSSKKGERVMPAHICGGALLKANIVITLSHCFAHSKEVDYYIYPNYHNTHLAQPGDKYIGISTVHPYNASLVSENYELSAGDLAIVALNESISLKRGLATVSLVESEYPPGTRLIVAGYGDSKQVGSTALRKAVMIRQDDGMCAQMHKRFESHYMLCAINEENSMVCDGDEGSPLVLKGSVPRNDVLVGLVAAPENCYVEVNSPSYFVNLVHFRKWIMDKIASLPRATQV